MCIAHICIMVGIHCHTQEGTSPQPQGSYLEYFLVQLVGTESLIERTEKDTRSTPRINMFLHCYYGGIPWLQRYLSVGMVTEIYVRHLLHGILYHGCYAIQSRVTVTSNMTITMVSCDVNGK